MLHTRRAHLRFIPDSLKSYSYFWNSWIFDSYCQCGSNLYVYVFVCVSSFSCLRETYVYNHIICVFSGALLGAAPARRLFLRRNFLIQKIER